MTVLKVEYGEKVKGISVNFLTFLWKSLSKVWELQIQGDYVAALNVALELRPFLPTEVDDALKLDEQKILSILDSFDIKVAPSHFVKVHSREKAKQIFAKLSLATYVRKMKKLLEPRGYFEIKREPVPQMTSAALRQKERIG